MAFGTEQENDADPEVEEREDADREPRSHAELRRNWQRLTRPGGRGRGAGPWQIPAPEWLGTAAIAVLLGGFLVAAAALMTGSMVVWFLMFGLIGYWFVVRADLPWWSGAVVALLAVFVANHSLGWLVLHGGLGTAVDGLRLAAADVGQRGGASVLLVPVVLGAAGGFVARHVRW